MAPSRIGGVLYAVGIVIVFWFVVGPWIGWLLGYSDNRHIAREGEPCGPHHRWVYARVNISDPDLSCEPER